MERRGGNLAARPSAFRHRLDTVLALEHYDKGGRRARQQLAVAIQSFL